MFFQADPAATLSDAELAQAALSVDGLLLKAAGVSDEQRFISLELAARQRFEESWADRAEGAIVVALRGMGGDEPATEADVDRIIRRVSNSFKGWAAEVRPMIQAVTRETYALAKQQISARATGMLDAIKPTPPSFRVQKADVTASFNLIDERTIAALEKNQLYWVGDHYDATLNTQIRDTVRETMLNQGLGRAAAGKVLEDKLQGVFGLGDQPKRYFEGLAAHVVTNARVHGAMRQMAQIGVTTYEVVNPLDERTCDRCKFMDGRKFTVRRAVELMDNILAAKAPDEAKAAHPWAGDVEDMKRSEAAGRLERDFPLPSYHFRCRCTVDISADAEFTPVDELTAPPPVPPQVPDRTGSKFLKQGQVVSRLPLGGGVNSSELLTIAFEGLEGIEDDAVWKAVSGEAVGMRSNIRAGTYYKREAAASDVAEQLGVGDMVPVTVQREINGVKGSLQAWAREARSDVALPLDEDAAARMRMFDFVIGNTDRHRGNVLWQSIGGKAKPVLIDNGLSFPTGRPDRFIQPLDAWAPDNVIKVKRDVVKLIDNIDEEQLARTLRKAEIEDDAIRETLYRVRVLKRDPQILRRGGPNAHLDKRRWEDATQNAKMAMTSDDIDAIDKIVGALL